MCSENDINLIKKTLDEYMQAQADLRKELEEQERLTTEKRIKKLTEKAKINPSTIWEIRKKSRTNNDLEYDTITEEGETILDPEKTKEHIANYFEDLYQARPGTPEYEKWTNEITKHITDELKQAENKKDGRTIESTELKKVIKKLKRNKSLGPDKIPNEIFIEANDETIEVYNSLFNKIYETEEIPLSWLIGHILRLYKGKGIKGQCSNERGITLASNPGKVFERIINERTKKDVRLTDKQAGGIPGSATCDHLIILDQTIQEIRRNKKTAYIVFLDVQKAYDKAWLDGILYALNKNGVNGKNLSLIKKLNSNLKARLHTKYGLTREISIKDSIRQGGVLSVIEYATLIDEIAKELEEHQIGIKTESGTLLNSLLWMDDVCLIHHDPNTLQKMLDITNHVAKKYHIVFGAAKCKVVKIGPGKTSNIKLDGTVLEEVHKYKYLGKTYNSKGNLADHLSETEGKVMAATQKIMAETGNADFKGIRMQAIWQLVEATIIPTITYGSESWDPTQKELDEVQKIMNTSLKTLMNLPKGTPTIPLLKETGFLPIKHIINTKRILQAHRIEAKTGKSLIKENTRKEQSIWMKKTLDLMKEYKIPEEVLQHSKEASKTEIRKAVEAKWAEEISQEAEQKTKVKHWEQMTSPNNTMKRPMYMEKLSRKECRAILTTRTSMFPAKMNFKNGNENLQCRYCGVANETQQHLIEECLKAPRPNKNIKYKDIFTDNQLEKLKTAAETLNQLNTSIQDNNTQ